MGDDDEQKYDEDGIPICPNCKKNAEKCECWDFEVVHEIIAWRIENDCCDSDHLQAKVELEEEEEPEAEEPEEPAEK